MGSSKKTHLSLKQMAENVGLEVDEYILLLGLFIETSNSYLDELESAIDHADLNKVYETTHTIRGAAEGLGIQEISEIARTIEMNARQNILDGAKEAAESLGERIDYLKGVH